MSEWLKLDGCLTLLSLSASVEKEARKLRRTRQMLRLLYASKGSCTIGCGSASYPLMGERALLVLEPLEYDVTVVQGDCVLTQVGIGLDSVAVGYPLRELLHTYPEVKTLCEALCSARPALCFSDRHAMLPPALRLLQTLSLMDSPQREMHLSLTLSYLLGMISSCVREETELSKGHHRYVNDALRYIRHHYMNSITTTDIACQTGVHVSHLHRLFLSEVGMSIGEYVISLRMDKACSLLMRTDMPIAMIATQVGANTEQYFCRLFKRRIGMTPGEYRRHYNLTCHSRRNTSGADPGGGE
ncbi:MAG: helix-turn-helix transcriptional regulator [Eubacteriales bacterium]|nr:helix-turn-helix transcriptional regulator [Eubacteriales bacterium]